MPRPSRKPLYIDQIKRLYLDKKHSLVEISKAVPVSVQTMSRWLTEDGIQLEARPRNPNVGRTAEQQEQINRKIKATWQEKVATEGKPAGRTRKVAREQRICPECGGEFEVLVTSPKKFCSMHCARFNQARIRQQEVRDAWYASEESSCSCGEKIPYEHRDTWKYCSPECRGEYGAKRQPDPANHVTFHCQNCGKETTRPRGYGNGHHKYCSNDCARRHTKTRKFYAVEGFDIVFESSWECLFWGLCSFLKIPVERFDREHGVEWKPGQWYAPDFWLPSVGVAVEIKGQEDEDDLVRWEAFWADTPLVVLDQKKLQQLRMEADQEDFVDLLGLLTHR